MIYNRGENMTLRISITVHYNGLYICTSATCYLSTCCSYCDCQHILHINIKSSYNYVIFRGVYNYLSVSNKRWHQCHYVNRKSSGFIESDQEILTYSPLLSNITFCGNFVGINSWLKNIWGLFSIPFPSLLKVTMITPYGIPAPVIAYW